MNEMEKFYFDGYLNYRFESDENTKSAISSLKNIVEGNIKNNFQLLSKYPNTYDLRPLASQYDDSFLNMLLSTGAYKKMCDLTGTRLDLFHVQVRVTSKSSNLAEQVSYMDWHRDTYFKDSKIMGYFPPCQKIIFYPSFEEEPKPMLKVLPGSHRMDVHYDQTYSGGILNNFDKSLLTQVPSNNILSSNNDFTIFNTALLHGAYPDQKNSKSVRIIYSFLLPEQMKKDHPEHHRELGQLFRRKVDEYAQQH
jgi:hypothetical protein